MPTENFEARAVRLYSFSAAPGKQCLPPKVSLEGLRDRPVEYTTCVKGIRVIAQSCHYKREFRGQSWSAVLIFRNPGKQCLPPKVSLEGLRNRPVEYTTCVKGIRVIAQRFHSKREFRGQSCSAVLIFSNPRKAMLAPKSVSRGFAGSSCWIYYMCKRN